MRGIGLVSSVIARVAADVDVDVDGGRAPQVDIDPADVDVTTDTQTIVTPDIDDVGFMSISVKLMGVRGPKLMDEEKFTQDWPAVVTPTFVTPNTRENAKLQYWSTIDEPLLYARIDMVRDRDGRWLLMEAELIEPDFYLDTAPEAGAMFGRAVAELLADGFAAHTLAPTSLP